jgi:hypothetical protein
MTFFCLIAVFILTHENSWGSRSHMEEVKQQYACGLTKLYQYCNCKICDFHSGLMKINVFWDIMLH